MIRPTARLTRRLLSLLTGCALLGGGFGLSAASAGAAAPQIVRGTDLVAGRTVKSWSASFLTWQIERAKPNDCQAGQRSRMFFIPTSLGGHVKANCTVPAGTPVFILPAGGACIDRPFRLPECPAVSPVAQRQITQVGVKIDGVPVKVRPADWIVKGGFKVSPQGAAPLPAVVASYSYVITGLSVGTHKIVLFDRIEPPVFRARTTATVTVQ